MKDIESPSGIKEHLDGFTAQDLAVDGNGPLAVK